jgi:hypothetical protein
MLLTGIDAIGMTGCGFTGIGMTLVINADKSNTDASEFLNGYLVDLTQYGTAPTFSKSSLENAVWSG